MQGFLSVCDRDSFILFQKEFELEIPADHLRAVFDRIVNEMCNQIGVKNIQESNWNFIQVTYGGKYIRKFRDNKVVEGNTR